MRTRLFSFDIFGTVLDWQRGLSLAVGRTLSIEDFERIIDWQGEEEQRGFAPYCNITARSLVEVLGVGPDEAARIGAELGRWPLFADSSEGMRRLQAIAPCMALTNSDRSHGEDVQRSLGFRLSHWLSAEEAGVYKPDEAFWRRASEIVGIPFGPDWWHVSAYGDYDLTAARRLGLTCVLIPRAHHRVGPFDVTAPDLVALAEIAARA